MARRPTESARASALNTGAVVKRDDNKQPDKETKKPEIEHVTLPIAMMMAAETIAAKAEKKTMLQSGILLHQKDAGLGRVVGLADGVGGRLFVGSFPMPAKGPSWLKPGLLISTSNLKARLGMISKVGVSIGETPAVLLAYRKGDATATLSDEQQTMAFTVKVGVQIEQHAAYEEKFTAASFIDLDAEGAGKARRDWEPVGFNSKHMKDCHEVAKLLESTIPKELRDDNGLVIRTFSSGQPSAPRVFDFEGVPGAILMLASTEIIQTAVPAATARLLEPATKGTLAALRAHATRWRQMADETKDPTLKAQYEAKEQSFLARVNDILARVPEGKAQVAGPAKPAAAQLPAQPPPQASEEDDEEDEDGPNKTVH